MKQKTLLVSALLIILALILFLMVGCQPVRYVNVHSRHNYYQKHRSTTYTSPVWIPGKGVVLETHSVPHAKYHSRRGKH